MAKHQDLVVSETFYSIQGEGPSAGTPAVFLRLAGCNLQCTGFSYVDPHTGEHLGCDTKAVWRKGIRHTAEDLLALWEARGWLCALRRGAHLVITGGEPLLQADRLQHFIAALDKALDLPPQSRVFLELETNGTFAIPGPLFERLNQLNISPKLAHSAEPKDSRYKLATLRALATHPGAFFKFVVCADKDAQEICDDFITPLRLDVGRVSLMPEGGTARQMVAHAPTVVEMCKTLGTRYSPRLQLSIWDQATGV